MTKTFCATLLLIWTLACATDSTRPDDSAVLGVSVQLTGDPTLGPRAVAIWVDDKRWLGADDPIGINQVAKNRISAGVHIVEFITLDNEETCVLGACWYGLASYPRCTEATASKQPVAIAPRETRLVTFVLHCQ